jgi:tRNA pseudouridine13 synthase
MRLLTRDLPGTGGLHKTTPEDFVVDELPAYAPSGEGAHTFLRIEKRALTTADAVTRLCRALAVSPRDAGVAGQKDRQALSRQWISLPGVDPARALLVAVEGVRVLEAARHGHKLRTGHLRANRFTLTVRGVGDDALSRARTILTQLEARGLPNYFGAQRFGARGDNAIRGKELIDLSHGPSHGPSRGPGHEPSQGPPPRTTRRLGATERRMLVSAYQAELFNRYLDARIDDGLERAVLGGDVVKKTDSGGLFTVDDTPDARRDAQARLEARALVVTGPIFGHKVLSPPEGTAAHAREQTLLAAESLDADAWKTLGKLAEGTRRPLLVAVDTPSVREAEGGQALVLEFTLPSGSYATVLLKEITK